SPQSAINSEVHCARAGSVCEILEGLAVCERPGSSLGAGSYRLLICGGEAVKSLISKRSIVIAGHKTSVSLEDEFCDSLKEIAKEGARTLAESVDAIDLNRQHSNLSAAIRLFVLGFYRDQLRKALRQSSAAVATSREGHRSRACSLGTPQQLALRLFQ